MRTRRLVLLGAIAALLFTGIVAPNAMAFWEVSNNCQGTGNAYCYAVGQDPQYGTQTWAYVRVLDTTFLGFNQYEFPQSGITRWTGVTAEAAGVVATAGQSDHLDGVRPARETGVVVGQGATNVAVVQHVDLTDNSCVFRVSTSTGAPTDVPCPAGTEIKKIADIRYTVPPGVEEKPCRNWPRC